jgi:hypothetical protein
LGGGPIDPSDDSPFSPLFFAATGANGSAIRSSSPRFLFPPIVIELELPSPSSPSLIPFSIATSVGSVSISPIGVSDVSLYDDSGSTEEEIVKRLEEEGAEDLGGMVEKVRLAPVGRGAKS